MKSKAKRRQPDMRELGEASLKASERENPQLFSRAKRLSLLSLVIFIVVLVYTFYEVKFNGEVVRKNLQVAPLLPIALLFLLAIPPAIMSTIAAFLQGFRSNPKNLLLDPLVIPKAMILESVINIFLLALSTLIILYLSGFTALLFNFFQTRVFPSVSSFVNMVLANLVGWILSGVIGNFVYDILKRIVTRGVKQKDS